MHVLIFEPSGKGHRYEYVKLLASELLALRCEVTLLTGREFKDSEQWREQLAPLESRMDIVWANLPVGKKLSYMQQAQLSCRLLRQAMAILAVDHVMVMSADGCGLLAWPYRVIGRRLWPKNLPVEAILFVGEYAHQPQGWKKRLRAAMGRWLLRHGGWRWLHFVDPTVYEWTAANDPQLLCRAGILPAAAALMSLKELSKIKLADDFYDFHDFHDFGFPKLNGLLSHKTSLPNTNTNKTPQKPPNRSQIHRLSK